MLQLKNIKKDYKTSDYTVQALKGVDLCFRKNEFVSILGQSGCGKTTLLNIIGGLDHYTSGDLVLNSSVAQGVLTIYNDTLGIVEIGRGFYTVSGREIKISQKYFETLPSIGVYTLTVKGVATTFTVQVEVTALPKIVLQDLTLQEGVNAVFFVGRENVTEVKVEGAVIDTTLYSLKNGMLTIDKSVFKLGENRVELSGGLTAVVTVGKVQENEEKEEENEDSGCGSYISGMVFAPIALAVSMALRRKRYGNDD